MNPHCRPTVVALAALVAVAGCASSGTSTRPRSTTAASGTAPVSRPAAPAEYGLVSRQLTTTEQASIDSVYTATQAALHELELTVVDKTKDRINATLAARTAHDERVDVTLERLTSGVTDVKIKVGFWGDESQSRVILTEIRRQLAMSEAQAKPDEFSPVTSPSTDGAILAAAPATKPATKKSTVPASPTKPAPITPVSTPASPGAAKPPVTPVGSSPAKTPSGPR